MDSIQDPPIQNLAVLPLRYPDWRMIDELVYIFYSSSAFNLRPFRITTKHMGSNPPLSTASNHDRDICPFAYITWSGSLASSSNVGSILSH